MDSGNNETEKAAAPPEGIEYFKDATIPPWRFWLLSVGLCLGLFLSMLDTSIVATSLYTIGVEFGDLRSINWVALAYTLTYLSCAVLFARVSDIVGRRDAFLASFIIFFGFSLGCGFAQTMNQLIACRALQGVGGSGLYSITMIIFPELSPDHLKQHIASLVGLVIAAAGVLGPVLGGVLTYYASWRWVFWINGPIGFISMIIFYLTWPKAEHLPTLQRRSWRELDIVGSFLLLSGAALIVFSFQNIGSNAEAWRQPLFIAPVVIGLLSWVALFVWERVVERLWEHRILAALPLRLLRNRVYSAGVLNTMFLGFPYLLVVYSFPVHLQVVNGKSALLGGVLLLPMLGSVAVGASLGGIINSRKNLLFESLVASSCLMALGCGLLATVSSSYELEPKALGFLVFVGLGFGLSATSSGILAATESEIRDHAPAQGIIAQMRILGGSIAIAASTAILGTKEREGLAGLLTPEELALLHTPALILTDAQQEAVRQAYGSSFQQDMKVAAAVSAAAVIVSIGAYQRHRVSLEERRKQQIAEEMERRRISSVPMLSSSASSA